MKTLTGQAIQQIRAGQSLDEQQMAEVIREIMSGRAKPKPIAELLTALHEKGETVDELVGAARALRDQMQTLKTGRPNLVDTCGTGGSGTNLFNVSTAAALVAAAAGASVAKHGNRSSTSKSGSADVLQEMGLNIECSRETSEKCLNQFGICFCYAPLFHPSVATVARVRQKLSHPTIFNLLGPLCNPARAPYQLLGAGRGETRLRLAKALARLGTTRAMVVHGRDGLGEITISGPTDVTEIHGNHLTNTVLQPADFGIEPGDTLLLKVYTPQQSADLIRRVLEGQSGPARDIVLINAAAAVWVAGISDDLANATERCAMAIDKGHAKELLEELIELTRSG